MKFIFLQTPIITDSINNTIVEEKTLSIMELISSGGLGGNIIMGTLGLLSIYAIYIAGISVKSIWFVTPFGGLLLIVGWFLMLLFFLKKVINKKK